MIILEIALSLMCSHAISPLFNLLVLVAVGKKSSNSILAAALSVP